MITGIDMILAGVAILGFLPLGIILYKRNRVKKILTTGTPAQATVYEVRTLTRPIQDIVFYAFYPANNTKPITGKFTVEIGKYKKGDALEIYYLPEKPQLNTLKGAWGSNFIVGFGIVIALFILFAVYKLFEMIHSGQM